MSRRLNNTSLRVAHYPVGLDDHIEKIDPSLGVGMDKEVRMIGMCGDEGIGKSTVARAIFNLYRHGFNASSFLSDVKATSRQDGLVTVQEILLRETLARDDSIKVGNPYSGVNVIVRRLGSKKVLLVVDGVDELDQLRQLAGDEEWFGPGSRIIVTTQDRDLLQAHGVKTPIRGEVIKQLSLFSAFLLVCIQDG